MLLRNMNVKELILQEAFHQNFPLEVDKFIDYCKKRGLNNVDRKYLEHLEQEERLKPIMRVVGSVVSNTTDLKELYENNHVIDPSQNGFVPWKTFYETGTEYPREVIRTYYHPYQIYSLNSVLESRIRALTRFNIIPQNDESVVNIRKDGKNMGNRPEIMRKNSKKDEKFVELLLFIQNKYLPIVKQPGHIIVTGDRHSPTNNLYERWYDLQKRIIPKEIVRALGLEAKDIDDYRGSIGGYGRSIDPLNDWYDLIKYITYGKRQKLKGKALLAQDFYLISDMLALLLEDLTGEKQLETGSLDDTMRGRGKARVYDKELNYVDRDVLIKLLREYGINPRPRLVLIVEGDTEEVAFPIIANAMGIPLERYGIQIINIQGVDKHPRELIVHHSIPDIYPERTKVFLIFDKEGNKGSWIEKFIKNPNKEIEGMMEDVLRSIKQKKKNTSAKTEEIFHKHTVNYKIWDNSFEYDNFSDEELSRELNRYGEKYGHSLGVTTDEIKDCRERKRNLDKFIRDKTERYLFSWDNVPGNENERLIKYLKDKFDINGVEISKSRDDMTLSISEDETLAKIIMDGKKKKASLKICDDRTSNLKVKTEESMLNIYTYTSLNKREFGEQLANFIAKEIKERTNRFENQRKIENVLEQIIRFAVE